MNLLMKLLFLIKINDLERSFFKAERKKVTSLSVTFSTHDSVTTESIHVCMTRKFHIRVFSKSVSIIYRKILKEM